MNIRAFFRAATVEEAASPYNTIHLKVFYPAHMTGSDQEQDLGVVPADTRQAPFKVVVFLTELTAVLNCINGWRFSWQGVDW